MTLSMSELAAIAPLLIIVGTAIVVLLVDAMRKNTETLNCWLSVTGLVAGLVCSFRGIGPAGTAFGAMVTTGGFSGFFTLVFCTSGILTVLLSKSYLRVAGIAGGEYYVLILFAIAGMIMMAAAGDLVIFFIGLELMSVSFYVLAGLARARLTSNEAALKYFLLGAFSTGFLLYGIALLYGATGSTNIAGLLGRVQPLSHSMVFLIGLALLMIGLTFKVAGVPFHMWVPDVYEGSPTTVSGFMSTGGKAAAFAGFMLVFTPFVFAAAPPIRVILAIIAALSMIAGNVVAVAQTSIKRMLAYSSIAHAGYILTGVTAGNPTAENGILFYLMSYTFMNVGAFGVVSMLEPADGRMLTFSDCAGLSRRSPFLAGLTALLMFSLAGIPPFAGFFGKYYVFAGAIEAGYTWLAIVGVLMSVVSVYYYLRLVVVMYFGELAEGPAVAAGTLGLAAVVIAAAALIGFGVFPSTLLALTAQCF